MGLDGIGWERGGQNDGIYGYYLFIFRGCIFILVYVNGCYYIILERVIYIDDIVNVFLQLCNMLVLRIFKDEDGF